MLRRNRHRSYGWRHVQCQVTPHIRKCGIHTLTVLPGLGNISKPHGRLVPVACTRCRACSSGLSTRQSSGGLQCPHGQGKPYLGTGFTLRCFQRLSLPRSAILPMPLAGQQAHGRRVHPGPLVLRAASLKFPPRTADRDRTVSRRTEPSSRTALMGEQPNPSHLLQREDAMSRHRGAKPGRRCGLLDQISLLSPG